MEHYTVFIVALKEIMTIWTPLKITLAGVLLLLAWRYNRAGHPARPG